MGLASSTRGELGTARAVRNITLDRVFESLV
jgi:hypothetical protein